MEVPKLLFYNINCYSSQKETPVKNIKNQLDI